MLCPGTVRAPLELAPGVEQREIEPDLERTTRLQDTHRTRVVLELRAVALELRVEELPGIAALVGARLPVDDPAHPGLVHERAVDAKATNRAVDPYRDRELARCVPRRRVEQLRREIAPPEPVDGSLRARKGFGQMRIVHARFAQYPPPGIRPRRQRLARAACAREAVQLAV